MKIVIWNIKIKVLSSSVMRLQGFKLFRHEAARIMFLKSTDTTKSRETDGRVIANDECITGMTKGFKLIKIILLHQRLIYVWLHGVV